MDAFRAKQAEMKRLREEAAAREAAGGTPQTSAPAASAPQTSAASQTTATSQSSAPQSAAERFRSLKRSESTPVGSGSGASGSSASDGKSAASYFLKKKSERKSTDPPVVALQLKTDLSPEQYKAMYERAVKDNQLLVKKYNERDTEVKKLRRELKRGGDARMSRMSRRSVTREQRMSMAMSTQLGGQLGNLLQLVQNLDEQIKASESARQYAEEKLIEMALQKIDVTEALKKVDEALEKIATRMRGGGNVDKELVANILTKIRKDILGADVDEQVVPVAAATGGSAAAPPPMPTGTAAAAAGGKPAARGGLLAQIRAGVQLSRVDVEKLKAQRKKERLMTARQSVRMMQSLEETLRNALEMRGLEMNPDDPNQIEDDWSDDDDY